MVQRISVLLIVVIRSLEEKLKYRIVSNCSLLSNCGPPYFINQEICYDMLKIDIFFILLKHTFIKETQRM